MPSRRILACRALLPVFAPLALAARVGPARHAITQDISRWGELATRWRLEITPGSGRNTWLVALLLKPEFRSLVYHRLRSAGLVSHVAGRLLAVVYRPQVNLHLDCPDVGPGLYFEHGFSTIVNAERIGTNCWINQQVTIGIGSRGDRPTLGDDVSVRAGAIVIGGVTLGDGCSVYAGAVVTKDVPPRAAVAGVPARVVRSPE